MKNLGYWATSTSGFCLLLFKICHTSSSVPEKGPDFSSLIVDMAAAKHPASAYEAPLFRI